MNEDCLFYDGREVTVVAHESAHGLIEFSPKKCNYTSVDFTLSMYDLEQIYFRARQYFKEHNEND